MVTDETLRRAEATLKRVKAQTKKSGAAPTQSILKQWVSPMARSRSITVSHPSDPVQPPQESVKPVKKCQPKRASRLSKK